MTIVLNKLFYICLNKTKKMNIKEQLQAEIKEANFKLKLVEAIELMDSLIQNPTMFDFTAHAREQKLLGRGRNSGEWFFFSKVNFQVRNFDHHNEIYKICFDKPISTRFPELKKYKAAAKMIISAQDTYMSFIREVVNELKELK